MPADPRAVALAHELDTGYNDARVALNRLHGRLDWSYADAEARLRERAAHDRRTLVEIAETLIVESTR